MKKLTLLIEIECGSKFQHDVLSQKLEILANAIKLHAEVSHKKNKVKWLIRGIN